MVESCCVEGCNAASDDLEYFKFPTSRSLKQKWLEAVSVSGALTLSSVVCSRHFSPEDYELVRGKTRLKRRVVPVQVTQSTKSFSSPSQTEAVSRDHINNLKDEPPDIAESENDNNQNDENIVKNEVVNHTDFLDPSKIAIENNSNVNEDDTELSQTDSAKNKKVNNNKSKTDSKIRQKLKTDAVGNKLDVENLKDEQKELEKSTDDTESGKSMKIDDCNRRNRVKENGCETSNNFSSQKGESRRHLFKRIRDRCHLKNEPELNKDADIEDIITNYHIKQTKRLPAEPAEDPRALECEAPIDVDDAALDVEYVSTEVNEPTFIAVPTDRDAAGVPNEGDGREDCLMLLENVEVELDPTSLMFNQDSEVENDTDMLVAEPICVIDDAKAENPISLLTSSDEDEVIIQEPKIDTIEVSDEDEDDVPLVNLFDTKKVPKKKKYRDAINLYQYCCLKCNYRTRDKKEFKRHAAAHVPNSNFRACDVCPYGTRSAAQYARHQQKHKMDRNYKCHICSYRARHRMSLIYHMKTHSAEELSVLKSDYKCDSCGYGSDAKSEFLGHLQLCSTEEKRFRCDKCSYNTDRSADMKRHQKRRHDDDDDDEDYVPV